MFSKVFIGALLLTFVGIQIVHSLNCYSCSENGKRCKNQVRISCRNVYAIYTNTFLNQHLDGVTNATSNNFDCLHITVNHTNNEFTEFKGCVYRETNACSLPCNSGASCKVECNQCSGTRCNPADSLSYSGYTMLVSLFSVLGLKTLAA